MGISHLLEDFGALSRGSPVALTDVSLEELKLEAFEKGYQAGWEDALKAGADDTRNASADLTQNLKDLNFTYEEAHAAALASLKPVLDQMVNAVLPELAQKTLGIQITEQLQDLVTSHGPQPVEIVTAPTDHELIESMIGPTPPMQTKVIPEPSMAPGQVFIRLGNHQREIDITHVLQGIEQAISGFFNEAQRKHA